MPRAAHVIAAINVIHINLIGVAPARRQWAANHEPVPSVVEARTSLNDHRAHNHKAVLAPEMLVPVVIINAAVVPLRELMPFVLAGFVALPSFVAPVIVPLSGFVPLMLMAFVRFAMFTAFVFISSVVRVAVMIVLGKGRHRHSHS